MTSSLQPPRYPDIRYDPADPRLGSWLARPADAGRVALVGFPVDEGVVRNGGRSGAAAAPDAIRKALSRLTVDARDTQPFVALLDGTYDVGNVVSDGDLSYKQERLGEVVAGMVDDEVIPVVLGGGHETSYGHFLGYVPAQRQVHIINIDAHPDVRPLKGGFGHSGSPFRQAIEHPSGCLRRYSVLGLQPHAVSGDHVAYLREHGSPFLWRDELTADALAHMFASLDGPTLFSVDMDVVDVARAPGVSAPNTGGISPELVLAAAFIAGRNPLVTSMDIVEVNPSFDIDERTARLAALVIWEFLRGLAHRP